MPTRLLPLRAKLVFLVSFRYSFFFSLSYIIHHHISYAVNVSCLPPFSLIRDFRKQNTRGNGSKISVNHACYRGKMLFILTKFFFLCWVDYALEGSTFSLNKCDFSRMFHTEMSWLTYRFTVVVLSGRQDLPSVTSAFLWSLLKRNAFFITAE